MSNLCGFAVVLVLLLKSHASAHPYEGSKGFLINETEDGKVGFDEEVGGQVESVPYTVIYTSKYYEKRLYSPLMMACTELTYNITEEDGGEENMKMQSMMMKMYKRFTTKLLKKKPSRLMFMKLFRYISGLNQGVEEIPMTSPVMNLMIPLTKERITKQMCFYLGKRFQTEKPPKPVNNEVEIIIKEKLEVYVHTFGGYATKDATWIEESDKLKERLQSDKVEGLGEINFSKFLMAGYDSPMKFWNRRNEILYPVNSLPAQDSFHNQDQGESNQTDLINSEVVEDNVQSSSNKTIEETAKAAFENANIGLNEERGKVAANASILVETKTGASSDPSEQIEDKLIAKDTNVLRELRPGGDNPYKVDNETKKNESENEI